MSDRAPYSRVYWSVMEDPKFDGIRSDVRLFGSWSLLLVAADMAHPAPAFMPRTIPRACIARLAEAGLIDLLDGHLYRVHGLTAERERRKVAATTRGPDGTPTVPRRYPDGDLAKQSKAEQSKAEQSKDNARESLPGDDGRADVEAFLLITRRAPTPRQRQLLDGLLQVHDLTGPQWAADIMLRHPDDPIGAVIEADKVWRHERIEAAKADEVQKVVPHRPKARGLTGINAELAALLRAKDSNQAMQHD